MTPTKPTLSKTAQRVQEALFSKGLDFTVVELAASTRTASEAAAAIGCHVAQIVKSLVFRRTDSHQPVLVLASGLNRVNEKSIENVIGEKIIKADADFTKEVTGFAIGGVPPIGHLRNIETYIDSDLLEFSEVWAAAGTPHAVFKLKAGDLLHVTGGKIISIS